MNLVHSGFLGYVHLITALISVAAGTAVLVMRKGTRRHRQVGYVYWAAMVVMLATSFMLYGLFGGWGIFHWFALLAALTLIGGIVPVLTRHWPGWLEAHFAFMYWSVMGLYAALVAEMLTRIPETPFFQMVGVAIFVVMTGAYVGWFRGQPRWKKRFAKFGQSAFEARQSRRASVPD